MKDRPNICPWCHRKLPSWRSFAVLWNRERAIHWLMRNKDSWVKKPVYGGWKQERKPSDAWRLIATGLKLAGIYSIRYGLRDMPIDELVKEARKRLKERNEKTSNILQFKNKRGIF